MSMSASRSRELVSGMKAMSMEENDVFHTTPVGIDKGFKKSSGALADSSNSVRKGLGVKNTFPFNKPLFGNSDKKATKSLSSEKCLKVRTLKPRSLSATTIDSSKITTKEIPPLLNDFLNFESDDEYPEPEHLRRDVGQAEWEIFSQISLPTNENEFDDEGDDGLDVIDEGNNLVNTNSQTDEENDDYPEIETYSSKYPGDFDFFAKDEALVCEYERNVYQDPPEPALPFNAIDFMNDLLFGVPTEGY